MTSKGATGWDGTGWDGTPREAARLSAMIGPERQHPAVSISKAEACPQIPSREFYPPIRDAPFLSQALPLPARPLQQRQTAFVPQKQHQPGFAALSCKKRK